MENTNNENYPMLSLLEGTEGTGECLAPMRKV